MRSSGFNHCLTAVTSDWATPTPTTPIPVDRTTPRLVSQHCFFCRFGMDTGTTLPLHKNRDVVRIHGILGAALVHSDGAGDDNREGENHGDCDGVLLEHDSTLLPSIKMLGYNVKLLNKAL